MASRENIIISRHSLKPTEGDPESKFFEGISESGVELARKKAKEIYPEIRESKPGTITWIAGVSELPRTRSTAEIYIEEINKCIIEDKNSDVVLLKKQDPLSEKDSGVSKNFKNLIEHISESANKKYVVGVPLKIKQFTNRNWMSKGNKFTEYTTELLKKSEGNEAKFLELWMDDSLKEKADPSSEKQSEEFATGIERMKQFIKKYFSGRDIILVIVGHTAEINSFLAAKLGENISESYQKNINNPLKETETYIVRKKGEKIEIDFRDNVYEI